MEEPWAALGGGLLIVVGSADCNEAQEERLELLDELLE